MVLYYATQEQELSNIKTYEPTKAYGNFKNGGIVRIRW